MFGTKVVKTQVLSIGTQSAIQWSEPIRNTQPEWDFVLRMRGHLHTSNGGHACAQQNLTPAPGDRDHLGSNHFGRGEKNFGAKLGVGEGAGAGASKYSYDTGMG